jgi:cytochrome c oxidase assembly protein subunit 15
MAGLKAGSFAPTWPTLNGAWWPEGMGAVADGPAWSHNPIAVQFIHRGLGYLVGALVLYWHVRSAAVAPTGMFRRYRLLPLSLVLLQIVLGILTVVHSDRADRLLWLGTLHQFTAMLLLLSLALMLHMLSGKAAGKP